MYNITREPNKKKHLLAAKKRDQLTQYSYPWRNIMKTTCSQVAHQLIIALALFLTLFLSIGCTPTAALSDCDHPQNEASIPLPDFGFNFSGACGASSPETAPANEAEEEDELLKDIEEPPEEPSSDLAATLEEKQPTS
ncbi:MAG: hypothetical protein D3916_03215 [Candidatus Electrothrix sp. MAN1_4]|nr:hypothetical protein [Candidatus Electrothrix sp. MAN1_4]